MMVILALNVCTECEHRSYALNVTRRRAQGRRKEDVQTIERVPFFGSIPLLGKLFRSEVTTKIQSELIGFLQNNPS